MQQAVTGALNRSSRRRNPRYNEIDWKTTIEKNLRNYQPEYKTIIPEVRIGFGRKRRALKDIVLCLDQSGSMGASVVYSGIFGSVLASIPAVQTRMVVFDTSVVDLTKHKMDSEQMLVDEAAVKTVNRAKDTGRNVCAVGTTVMRAIESAVSTDGHLKEFEGWTNKFIFPPYEFTVANSMISNFHMPLSTLLIIVSAESG